MSSLIGHRALAHGPSVEFRKIRRRFALNSASDGNGTPSERALFFVTDSERLKTTDARSADAPDATSALKRSVSSSDQAFFLTITSRSSAVRPDQERQECQSVPNSGKLAAIYAQCGCYADLLFD